MNNVQNWFTVMGNIDEFGNPVERTKQKYPYSYDGFVTFRNGDNSEITGTVYSDRLRQWDWERLNALSKKHFGETGDYWNNRDPRKIESLLRDWVGDQNLKLILVMEYYNVSSGYPLWRFDYSSKQSTNDN